MRKIRALKIIQDQKAAGTFQAPGDVDNMDSWAKGGRQQEAQMNRSTYESE